MSIFPTKVLLATDGSQEATLAAQTAVDVAEKTSSELHVVHVGHVALPDYSLYSDVIRPDLEASATEEAQKLLNAQVEQIKDTGATVTQAQLRIGRPDEEILAAAEAAGVGLIVMGSRGLGGVRRALMGSVSDSVLRHAHCPVLVIRKEKHPAAL